MSLSRLALVLLVVSAVGCSRGKTTFQETTGPQLKTPAEPLAAGDVDRFLAILQSHGDGSIPEFTPSSADEGLDYKSRAGDLVSEIRTQFRLLFDARRQGKLWAQDDKWSQAFSEHQVTGPEFAALVQSVSCAVMRVRLDARVDVGRLVANARAEVKDIVSTMDAIDDIPEAERSSRDGVIRAQHALRLARAVALLEFSQMVKQVPKENCALVRRYSKQLKPLLPADETDGLLSELQALGMSRESDIKPASYSE